MLKHEICSKIGYKDRSISEQKEIDDKLMYELIILSLLMINPAHGYLIAKVINNIVGPYAKVSNGRLYPLLAKLQENGLIGIEQNEGQNEGGRHIRGYHIKEAGRNRFRQLMLDTTSNPGEYQKLFGLKAAWLDLLEPEERIFLLDHYVNYCQTHVLHVIAKTENMLDNSDLNKTSHSDRIIEAMQHRQQHWQNELEWVKKLRARETKSGLD